MSKVVHGVMGLLAFMVLRSTVGVYAAQGPAKVLISHSAIHARLVPLWIAKEQGFFSK